MVRWFGWFDAFAGSELGHGALCFQSRWPRHHGDPWCGPRVGWIQVYMFIVGRADIGWRGRQWVYMGRGMKVKVKVTRGR